MPQATLLRNDPAGTGLRCLTVDCVLDSYTTPGQFITATVADQKPALFALANSPGEPVTLLVKDGLGTAHALCGSTPGTTVTISEAQGSGFALAPTADRELVLLINGSGLSAARPVLRAELAQGLPRPVHLFYGVMHPDARAFRDDLDAWARAGIAVHTVVDPSGAAGWSGPVGYVQDVAMAQGCVRADSAVLLVGVPAMIDAARALCAQVGVPEPCVLVNF